MKDPLKRVLRVRAVFEDRARHDFERQNGKQIALEKAAEEQRQLSLLTRAEALHGLCEERGENRSGWLVTNADADILASREARFEALAGAAAEETIRAREEWGSRRIERRQLEALLTAAARASEKQRLRRDQDRIDDWFQGNAPRRNRK